MPKYPEYEYGMYVPSRRETDFYPEGEGLTRQEFSEECDINNIMKRYEKSGVINHFNRGEPQYVDFVGMPDLQGAMNMMYEAEEAFMRLPAVVRKRFENDPAEFVDFAQDPANIGQLREWGLAAPEKAPEEPMKVQVVNSPGPEGKAP